MNGEGISCSRTTDIEGAVTKPDMDTIKSEDIVEDSSGYCCFSQCKGVIF